MFDVLQRCREEVLEDVVRKPHDADELLRLQMLFMLRLRRDFLLVRVNLKHLRSEVPALLRFLVRKDHLVDTLAELTYNFFF